MSSVYPDDFSPGQTIGFSGTWTDEGAGNASFSMQTTYYNHGGWTGNQSWSLETIQDIINAIISAVEASGEVNGAEVSWYGPKYAVQSDGDIPLS